MKKGIVILLMLPVLMLGSCRLGEDENTEQIGPLHVVATTNIIGDALKNLLKGGAEVSVMMGPGTDPHMYKPTPGDVDLLDRADVIIANGLHLEGKMADMLDKYGKEKPVLFVADGIDKSKIIKSADYADSFDPHIWFDPDLWTQGLTHISNEMQKIDTSNAARYEENLINYTREIENLTEWIKTRINNLPAEKRVLITSHDAFSYFGRKFEFEVKGIQGISTISEVGLKEISNMVDFVIERDIASIFVETSTSQKTAQSIVDGAKDKGYTVSLKGPLFSDALGEPDSEGGTYIGMMKSNVNMIIEGLE